VNVRVPREAAAGAPVSLPAGLRPDRSSGISNTASATSTAAPISLALSASSI
jgi:hypothetical protein